MRECRLIFAHDFFKDLKNRVYAMLARINQSKTTARTRQKQYANALVCRRPCIYCCGCQVFHHRIGNLESRTAILSIPASQRLYSEAAGGLECSSSGRACIKLGGRAFFSGCHWQGGLALLAGRSPTCWAAWGRRGVILRILPDRSKGQIYKKTIYQCLRVGLLFAGVVWVQDALQQDE